MTRRKLWPWLPLAGLVIAAAVLVALHEWRRPTPQPLAPPEADGEVPPWMQTEFLQTQLRARNLNVTAVPSARLPGASYIFFGKADPALVEDVPPQADYADCWRGVVLFDPHAGGSLIDHDPYEFRLSSFRVFGDPGLVAVFRDQSTGAAKIADDRPGVSHAMLE
jgi:hypothetical protein